MPNQSEDPDIRGCGILYFSKQSEAKASIVCVKVFHEKEDKKGSEPVVKKRKKMALGRGLDALIPDIESIRDVQREFFNCDIGMIRPNRYQPRRRFSEEELKELSHSIKMQGVIQPLLVRKDTSGYELVTGERRLRAAKLAGLKQVPVVLKEVTDSKLLEISIIENVQREDLNPIEESEGYRRLMTEFNLKQNEVAKRVGKSRSAVANCLRLRQLPDSIKALILDGTLSMGHARALLGADTTAQQNSASRIVVSKGLSVRETERLVRRMQSQKKAYKGPSKGFEEIYISDLADELSQHLGTRVQIKRKGRKGKVEIEFYNDDDLDRLIRLLRET